MMTIEQSLITNYMSKINIIMEYINEKTDYSIIEIYHQFHLASNKKTQFIDTCMKIELTNQHNICLYFKCKPNEFIILRTLEEKFVFAKSPPLAPRPV